MSSDPSRWNDAVSDILRRCGVSRFGIVRAGEVAHSSQERYMRWIAGGRHAGMEYLDRYHDVRADVRKLLPQARSVICCAFAYWHPESASTRRIAAYALADDYHEVVRRRLADAASEIGALTGAETRVCVDTAPLRERYWACRAGLGFIGDNGHLIIPGGGSYYFLGEIITTASLEPTAPAVTATDCGRCGRCVRACPAGALGQGGEVDARRCISYLTIEHRGEFPEGTNLHGSLYGCDVCARVCPHNAHPEVTAIAEFTPRPDVVSLTPQRAAALTQDEFSAMFRHSAVKRTKLAGLQRNARQILDVETGSDSKID